MGGGGSQCDWAARTAAPDAEGGDRAADRCPVTVGVFAGNTADPITVASQVTRVRQRFGLESVALLGERGMLTTACLREDLDPDGLGWISALKVPSIRTLLRVLRPVELVPDQVAEFH